MAVAAFQGIRELVRRETLDTPGVRWTDDELDNYINIAQNTYARRTGHLKGMLDYYHNGIDFIYQVPSDYIRASSFILPDGNKTNVPAEEWALIAGRVSPKWLIDKRESPQSIVFDYEGWNRFRLYPNTNKGQGALLGTLRYSRLPVKDILEVKNIQTIAYYVLFRSYVKERGNKYLTKAQKYKKLFEKDMQKYKSRSTGTLKGKSGFRKVRDF